MITLDMDQGSYEWIILRKRCITSTDASVIMGENPYKSLGLLWKQKVLGEEEYVNEAMTRGSLLEPVARNFFNLFFNFDYQPIVALSDERPWQMASLDGIDSDSILEIKCPGQKIFDMCAKEKNPRYWDWQIQHALSVTGRTVCTLLVWKDENNFTYQDIDRDEEMINSLIEAEERFYIDHILTRREPEWERKSLKLYKKYSLKPISTSSETEIQDPRK